MKKYDELYELNKVPDSVLLKLSQQEVGELKSLVDELQYKIEELTKQIQAQTDSFQEACRKCDKETRKEIRREELYKNALLRNTQQQNRIRQMRTNNDLILVQCSKLERRIAELEQELRKYKQ